MHGASALPALQADQQLRLAVRSRASVRSLQLLGRQTGHGAPSLSASPPTLALHSAASPRPSAGLRESGYPGGTRQTAEALGRQFRWLRAWPPCPRPGLPISAPDPRQPGHPCPSVRHPRLLGPVLPSPVSVPSLRLRPASPAPVARALPALPHTGPSGLAPRAPRGKPRFGSTCSSGPRLHSDQPCQSENSRSDSRI